MDISKITVVIVLSVSIVHMVNAVSSCYRCDYDSEECKDPFVSTHSNLRTIAPHNSNPCDFCFKVTHKPQDSPDNEVDSLKKIERGCASSGATQSTDYCASNGTVTIGGKVYDAEVCYCNGKALCNGAGLLSASLWMLFGTLAVITV